jgi:hypothetical protein
MYTVSHVHVLLFLLKTVRSEEGPWAFRVVGGGMETIIIHAGIVYASTEIQGEVDIRLPC